MVDSMSLPTASARSNPFDPAPAFSAREAGANELADATNGVRATRVNGVEVILTQAEKAAEELTYENLKPRAFERGTGEASAEANPADSLLTDTGPEPA